MRNIKSNFKQNPDGKSEGTYSKYASLDNKIDGFHYYFMFLKFGIGRWASDASHEIREGHLSREEAINLVEKYDSEFPKKYFKVFLDYCNLSEGNFYKIYDKWRGNHIWIKKNNVWKLRHTVGHYGVND
tara:strand:- start:153 stop:539 length:387 start_codon:yes stop_codon:yes gene_type:complete